MAPRRLPLKDTLIYVPPEDGTIDRARVLCVNPAVNALVNNTMF